MGISASKSVPKIIPKSVPKPSNLDEQFGNQIMQNIKLKEYPLPFPIQNNLKTSNLRKRMQMDRQTEGTVSWEEFPLIFSDESNKLKIDKATIDELGKYFSIPEKQNVK